MSLVRMRYLMALAVAVTLAACGEGGAASAVGQGDTRADQNPIVLTIATGEGAAIEAQGFADAVADASGGSIEVRVDNKSVNGEGVPDYETKVIQYVATGRAELGFVAARAFDTVGVDAFAPLQAPFLIDSYQLEAQVLASPSIQALLDATLPAGVIGIGYVQGPLRRPLAYTHSLLDIGDYHGARIGVRGSSLIEETMTALGATPDVFPPGETNGLDGMEVHVAQIDLGKYDSGADSLTGNIVFWPRPGVIFANADAFEALTTGQQGLLREAGRRNLRASEAVVRSWEAGGLAQICRRGLRIKMAPDGAMSRLRAAVQPVYDDLEANPVAKATIMAIEEINASLRAPPDGVVCRVPAATPLPSQTLIESPIVGTWKTSYSKEEFQSSPFITDAGELNDEANWGDFALTFATDGHVTLAGGNAAAWGSTSGTYSIDGDRVVLMFDEGGNRGEAFAGRWSVFRDTLTFERVPPDILPTGYLVRAWTRAS
jgi:TRAP-type C4-dicarboxylate transport system substrate-binding protein